MSESKSTPPIQTKITRRRMLILIGVAVLAFMSQVVLARRLAPPASTAPGATPMPVQAQGMGATQVYTDGMVGVYVPAGEFLMGSTEAGKDVSPNEKPRHTVYLDAYWVDKTEVINDMFTQFVAETGYATEADKRGSGLVFNPTSGEWTEKDGANWRYPQGLSRDNNTHPVVQVSWQDAAAYCQWAGRRLPTEAEWEKAARGTDGRIYPWGNQDSGPKLANFGQAMNDTTLAGKYPDGASPYGALDMAGNVWEWVADWYSETYYSSSPSRNPTGPETGQYRVVHGGSWLSEAIFVRAASRNRYSPDASVSDVGFRCVRSP